MIKKPFPLLVVLILTLLLSLWGTGSVALGAGFTVDSTLGTADANIGDGVCDDGAGNCTLLAAIQETNALPGPDTVILPLGTYTNALGDLDIFDDLTIVGSGAAGTIIDGGGIDRVFHIASGTVTISGVTVQSGGNTGFGAGILNQGTLTLTNSTVSDNSAEDHGGGIYNSGTLTVINSMVSDNSGVLRGGGIYNHNGGLLLVRNSTVIENTSEQGGGIYNLGGIATVTNTFVNGNATTAYDGGGIHNTDGGTFYLNNSKIIGNLGRHAGGIYTDGTLIMNNTTVSGNTAYTFDGGGIFSNGDDGTLGTTTLTNSTISGNSAEDNGGGLYNKLGSTLTLVNTTISGNTTNDRNGGGIYNDAGSTLTLVNSTISLNQASDVGGGIYNDGIVEFKNTIIGDNVGTDCFGEFTSLGNNLISNNTGCSAASVVGDQINVDPRLRPLQDNGGPTETHALRPDSPAIDAGNDSGAPPRDQRSVPRPQGTASDIGAFEVRQHP